jgi:hypothetical protein
VSEGFECGIGNAECGIKGKKLKTHMKDRRQRTEGFECGIGNAECGKKKRRKRADLGFGIAARPGATASIKWHQSGTPEKLQPL